MLACVGTLTCLDAIGGRRVADGIHVGTRKGGKGKGGLFNWGGRGSGRPEWLPGEIYGVILHNFLQPAYRQPVTVRAAIKHGGRQHAASAPRARVTSVLEAW